MSPMVSDLASQVHCAVPTSRPQLPALRRSVSTSRAASWLRSTSHPAGEKGAIAPHESDESRSLMTPRQKVPNEQSVQATHSAAVCHRVPAVLPRRLVPLQATVLGRYSSGLVARLLGAQGRVSGTIELGFVRCPFA